MIRYLLAMAFLLCIMTLNSYSASSHKFTFMMGKYAGKKYCMYCHKPRSSYDLKPIWGDESINKPYNYISPDIDEKTFKKRAVAFRKITKVCLSCHSDIVNHKEYHPIDVNVMESNEDSLSFNLKDGKINGVLPLFGENKLFLECPTCHDPHSKEVSLLRVNKNILCQSCHDQ